MSEYNATQPKDIVDVYFSSEYNPGDWGWYTSPAWTENIDFKLSQQPQLLLQAKDDTKLPTINVIPSIQYQEILGIGVSLEESSIFNISRMSDEKRDEVLQKLIEAGVSLVRICFASSDFTGREWYSYDDMPPGETDLNLCHFSIQKDLDYEIINTIKKLLSLNSSIKVFASPWSPPAWMKTSGSLCGGSLLPQYYKGAAQYYRKCVQAYEELGIPINAFTIQNEPGVDVETYPSCKFTWEEERDFVQAVKSEFEMHNISTKVWILDHNFDMAMDYACRILDDPNARAKTDGVAFHDYVGNPEEMSKLYEAHPETDIFFTERSVWGTAGMDRIAQYFRNWASCYASWVIVLDSEKKPNNGPFDPDPTLFIQDASDYNKYWTLPEYYMQGQYMKFIQSGAKRIYSNYGSSCTVTNVAFINPDGTIVTVVINQNSWDQQFKIVSQNKQIVAKIPAKTVATYKWTKQNELIDVVSMVDTMRSHACK